MPVTAGVAFGFYFPTIASTTSMWEPSLGPYSSGTGGNTSVQEFSGVISNLLFDRKTFHKYREYEPYAVYTYIFSDLVEADRSAFRTFMAATAGAQFEVLDPIGDGETFFAQLMPDSMDLTWTLDREFGQRLSTIIRLFRDEEIS